MEEKILYYLNEIKKLQNKEFVPPVTCEIDPSNACPLNCGFCMFKKYLDQSNVHMSMENYLRLIYDLHRIGTKSITFTGGGEPLMNPNFNKFVDIAEDLGFEMGLVTNGVLLEKLNRPNRFKFIRVSLDASDSTTYINVKGADYFDKVIENVKNTLKQNPTVGLSYVVCPENEKGIVEAQNLANQLGVAYIQIKPAYLDGKIYKFKKPGDTEETIETKRYKLRSKLPCLLAHLVGIVTADGGVYYCCQHRGIPNFYLGSIAQEQFSTIWQRRLNHNNFSLSQCPMCRYANYAKYLSETLSKGDLFFEHKNFL